MPPPEPFDEQANRQRVQALRDRGVEAWGPDRVYIAPEVPLENIEPGATIYNATLRGQNLRIGSNTRIGRSGHALIDNCQIGREVELGAGAYEGATILDRASVRGWAEIRPGTLLEEDTVAAHNVAFKNTILTATVITGSLINYCDLFMSGGTSRSDHGEVGSGVIHFNFDPRGDKWGSLIGDVSGVLMRAAPIFIGGQVGLVGPIHIDFGTVIAAGSVVRRGVGPGLVHYESVGDGASPDFDREIYTALKRKFRMTARLIGNLHALDAWYEQVRLPFADERERPLFEAARGQMQTCITERIHRLGKIVGKLPRSLKKSTQAADERLQGCHQEHRRLIETWEAIAKMLAQKPGDTQPPPQFLEAFTKLRASQDHFAALKNLSAEPSNQAAAWLKTLAQAPADNLDQRLL